MNFHTKVFSPIKHLIWASLFGSLPTDWFINLSGLGPHNRLHREIFLAPLWAVFLLNPCKSSCCSGCGRPCSFLTEESGVFVSQSTLRNLPFYYKKRPSQLIQCLCSEEHLLIIFSTDVLLKHILLFMLASCKTSEKIQNNNEKWLCSQNQVNPIIFLTELITIMSNAPLHSLWKLFQT